MLYSVIRTKFSLRYVALVMNKNIRADLCIKPWALGPKLKQKEGSSTKNPAKVLKSPLKADIFYLCTKFELHEASSYVVISCGSPCCGCLFPVF